MQRNMQVVSIIPNRITILFIRNIGYINVENMQKYICKNCGD